MRTLNQHYELVETHRLSLHPENPRRGALPAIRESIETNGWYGAIVAQRSTGYVLVGNHRLQAALEAGATQVPVFWVDVDDTQARRILLVDNRTNDLAGYDDADLANLLQSILDTCGSLEGTAFDTAYLDRLLKTTAPNDEPATPPDASERGDQSDQIGEGFQILVDCESEAQQAELLERLTAEGYSCRALLH